MALVLKKMATSRNASMFKCISRRYVVNRLHRKNCSANLKKMYVCADKRIGSIDDWLSKLQGSNQKPKFNWKKSSLESRKKLEQHFFTRTKSDFYVVSKLPSNFLRLSKPAFFTRPVRAASLPNMICVPNRTYASKDCLPPPCNTPPKCLQYMTGYYYYPYGWWFCGPYHMQGLCCPIGPCKAGSSSGPCPPSTKLASACVCSTATAMTTGQSRNTSEGQAVSKAEGPSMKKPERSPDSPLNPPRCTNYSSPNKVSPSPSSSPISPLSDLKPKTPSATELASTILMPMNKPGKTNKPTTNHVLPKRKLSSMNTSKGGAAKLASTIVHVLPKDTKDPEPSKPKKLGQPDTKTRFSRYYSSHAGLSNSKTLGRQKRSSIISSRKKSVYIDTTTPSLHNPLPFDENGWKMKSKKYHEEQNTAASEEQDNRFEALKETAEDNDSGPHLDKPRVLMSREERDRPSIKPNTFEYSAIPNYKSPYPKPFDKFKL